MMDGTVLFQDCSSFCVMSIFPAVSSLCCDSHLKKKIQMVDSIDIFLAIIRMYRIQKPIPVFCRNNETNTKI